MARGGTVPGRRTATADRHRQVIRRGEPPCGICHQPIDYTLGWVDGEHGPRCRGSNCKGCVPHPMRFEADHVVPLHRGGADTLENSRAAHRKCNKTKRARLVAPIVRRSGALD